MPDKTTPELTEAQQLSLSRLDRVWRSHGWIGRETTLNVLVRLGLAEVKPPESRWSSRWSSSLYRLTSTGSPTERIVDAFENWAEAEATRYHRMDNKIAARRLTLKTKMTEALRADDGRGVAVHFRAMFDAWAGEVADLLDACSTALEEETSKLIAECEEIALPSRVAAIEEIKKNAGT